MGSPGWSSDAPRPDAAIAEGIWVAINGTGVFAGAADGGTLCYVAAGDALIIRYFETLSIPVGAIARSNATAGAPSAGTRGGRRHLRRKQRSRPVNARKHVGDRRASVRCIATRRNRYGVRSGTGP
jgi:hypothetical protein